MKIKDLKKYIEKMDDEGRIEVLFYRGDGRAHIYDLAELSNNEGNLNIVVRKEDKSVTVDLKKMAKALNVDSS